LKEPFAFALAISSYQGFEKADNDLGVFSMSYLITGGPDNGKTFDISFSKCNDADW